MEAVAQMGEFHDENITWINNLRFYETEISSLNKRLEEAVKRTASRELMAQVEHFQNQFIRQREVADEIKHHVKNSDKALYMTSKSMPVSAEHRLYYDHSELRDQYDTFEKLYHELKDDFNQFLNHTS